jgi:hypothetical protein
MPPQITALPPLELEYKPDAAEAQMRLNAYWQGEIIDRACVAVSAPRIGKKPPYRSLIVAEDFNYPRAIAEFQRWAECVFFGGEAMPALMPNFGPDQWASFLGANTVLAPEKDTSWVDTLIRDWDEFADWRFDSRNVWWKGILELARLAAKACEGKFILSTIDTHSNLDCLAALRGREQLCIDLIDRPHRVLHALRQVDALYQPVYDAVYEAGGMRRFGTTSWLEMWSEGKTQALQCDFCCMLSREHFRKFALPSLEYEISCLDHAVYHMDGVGQIRHLDDLLALPRLHTIQWIPGAGQPPVPHWLELLRKIQNAGKSVQVCGVTPEELKAIYRELSPEKTFYWVRECANEAEARNLIGWMAKNT